MKIDISTQEKKEALLELFKSFSKKKDIYEYYNVSSNTANIKYINSIAEQIGFDFSYYTKTYPVKYCLCCGKELDNHRKKFCNTSCAATFNNSNRTFSEETKEKISNTLRNKESKVDKQKKTDYKKTSRTPTYHLKDKLFRDGIKEKKCEICGLIDEWKGKPLTLQLHHINGNRYDNRIENLQILCPNCHSQTDNYCALNRKSSEKIVCVKCGKEKYYSSISGMCKKCYDESLRGKNIPDKETLENVYNEYKTYYKISRHFKVSTKTVKRWLEHYNII